MNEQKILFCPKCNCSTTHEEVRYSITGEAAKSLVESGFDIIVYAFMLPIIGWVLLPFAIIGMAFITPLGITLALLSTILPKFGSAYQCVICDQLRR